MSTNPLRRGCSPAQTFPLFHVRGRSARSPTAQASRSTPFVECKFDEWKHYRRTVSFTRACVPFKNTGHIVQGNERDTATCAVSLSCRKCDTAMPSEPGTNYGKTAGKRPEKMHIRRSKQIRHKGEHDLQGRTHPERTGTDGRTTTHTRRGFRLCIRPDTIKKSTSALVAHLCLVVPTGIEPIS